MTTFWPLAGARPHPKYRVLVVDEGQIIREALEHLFGSDPRFAVVCSANVHAATGLVAGCDVIVIGAPPPHANPSSLVQYVRACASGARILVYSSYDDGPTIRDAINAGAAGYIARNQSVGGLLDAVAVVADGGQVISPTLQHHLFAPTAAPCVPVEVPTHELRPVELQVVRLVAAGATDRDIALALCVSERTVQNVLRMIRTATGTHRRVDLTRWAVGHGLI